MLLNEGEKRVKSLLEKLKEIGANTTVSSIKFFIWRKRLTRFFM
ncbi:hypothetical protein YN1HA_18440 [Sulfurisphaera ohwakuensis]